MSVQPITEPKRTGCLGNIGLLLFGALFFSMGSFFLWLLAIHPMVRWWQAQDWTTVPCTITTSQIEVVRGDDSDSYRPDVKYEYEVDDQKYTGATVDFSDGMSGSHRRADKIVKRYPVGARSVCQVDPDDPTRSVLVADFPFSFFWFFPLPFVLVGLGVIYAALRSGKKTPCKSRPISAAASGSGENGTSTTPRILNRFGSGRAASAPDELDQEWSVPQKLKPESSRWVRVIAVGIFMLVWNTIVGVFFYQEVASLAEGGLDGFDVCTAAFMIPFVLVGIGVTILFFYFVLALFNPVVEIAMTSGAIPLGETVDIAWDVEKNLHWIRQLKISIVGTESATYRRGTSTHTDTHEFYRQTFVETSQRDEIDFGSATVAIPADTMHTFEALRNKIVWTIQVEGDIRYWPDVKESFPFRVMPQPVETKDPPISEE